MMRFIDDLLGLNHGGEFTRFSGEIYPSDLELKEEHSVLHATFFEPRYQYFESTVCVQVI